MNNYSLLLFSRQFCILLIRVFSIHGTKIFHHKERCRQLNEVVLSNEDYKEKIAEVVNLSSCSWWL
jgi:hypothetical protein